MKRRNFILAGLAFGLIGPPWGAPAAPGAAPRAVPRTPRFAPTRFSVVVRGAGPDVILIPGLASGRDVWEASVAAVPGYRYHLIQVAGFVGDPPRGNRAGAVLAPLADEIARYIADRGLVRPAIVGHSMGGTLGMMIGARHPRLAGRIMVVDMLPQPASLFGGTAADVGPLARSLQNYFATPGGRRLFTSFMTAFSPPSSGHRRSDPDVSARAMHDLAATNLTGELARIRAPLTIVYASPDPRASAAVDRSFAYAYVQARGARLVRIDQSGHLIMHDRPARFHAVLREFLRAT